MDSGQVFCPLSRELTGLCPEYDYGFLALRLGVGVASAPLFSLLWLALFMRDSFASPELLIEARATLARAAIDDPELDLAELALLPGPVFVERLPRLLKVALGADYVFLATPSGKDWSRMQSIGSVGPDGVMPQFEYDLHCSPCSDVLQGEPCCFRGDLARLFPDDELLQGLELRAYAGNPLLDDAGQALGIVAACFSEEISEEHGELCLAVMHLVCERLHAYLECSRVEAEHQALIDIGSVDSSEILRDLVQLLQSRLDLDHSFLLVPEGPAGLHVLASIRGGHADPGFSLLRRGTAFEELRGESEVFLPHSLAERYPSEPWLTVLGDEALWARQLEDKQGRILGIFGLSHGSELMPAMPKSKLLPIFAQRFRAELLRRRAEEDRSDVERRLLESRHHEQLSILAGGVAHDFRNLLTGIVGQAEFARAELEGEHHACVHLDRLLVMAERAGQLCHHLQAYAGRRPLDRRIVDVRALIEEQIQQLDPSLTRRVRIDLSPMPDPLPVQADPGQLSMAFGELLRSVCAEGMSGVGRARLQVCVELVELSGKDLRQLGFGDELQAGPYVRLRLNGMRQVVPTEPERLQDPYFTSKIRPQRRAASGLALATVIGIARKHGGALLLPDSGAEQGELELLLLLPMAGKLAGERKQEETASTAERSTRRVLVVDDEQVVREVASLGLTRHGYEVDTVASGAEALELLVEGAEAYELLLLDLSMPGGLDGLEVILQLRGAGRKLPIILMSGMLESRAQKCLEEFDDVRFLEKPFRNARLLESVDQVFS